ncbi:MULTISPECIES: stringent starvation protein SspA [Gammaproteobacteria]|uniref:Stringent starvation protein A n=1 Tax=Vreelandella halophila TaxID=86177 RepID=A0A9X4YCF9_9GAMM|nr:MULTISPECIES: stringent starvation protein SspA [Gammaproteobacteria]KAA8980668.1 stringent starvation protein A [Halospina sp. K52047b]MYL26673.1 stringent starvation protein A [Halomonas utahensis]MYL74010.1 stringent starvation protein A [Halomonas sp. 22501_18_FS]
MAAVTKRSSMTFFSDPQSHYSHRVRIVLAEKGVTVDVVNVDPSNPPSELADLNPYNALPTLVDRDLVLYEPNIMMEYLDERFPHPPLLPVYPVARAQSRLMMWRVGRDWCSLVDRIEAGSSDKDAEQARKELRESLVASAPLFQEMPFFLSEEFTMADCCIGPLLWRLPALGVELPAKGIKPLEQYMERLFERRGFRASLSDAEEDMRT